MPSCGHAYQHAEPVIDAGQKIWRFILAHDTMIFLIGHSQNANLMFSGEDKLGSAFLVVADEEFLP